MIPQVESCCGSISLKSGTKVIGWITLVANIIFLLITGIALAALFYIKDHSDGNPDTDKAMKLATVVMVVLFIIQLILCLLPVMLLVGVYKDKGGFLIAWVWITLVICILSLIGLILTFNFKDGGVWTKLFYYLLNIYFAVVVNSYYKETYNRSSSA